jgi:GTPase SAR1 family protein
MTTSVAERLEDARMRLKELGRLTAELASAHPNVFEESELRESLVRFNNALREGRERLANPTLSIATIGTTSSGKSTIVNALVGRRIAPIEAGEMSGGVLTLRHTQERRLTVDAAEGAPWEAGTWTGISDAEAYSRIRDGVMRPYHDARKSRSCPAPQVLAEGPLLPAVDPALLGLPPNLTVEFIDLPGLKSVQDRANLAVIQTRVHKAFSLVALDYFQTDEEHRKKLLEELTRVVKYLQGRPDSMLFVLNRVDGRGHDDEPIEVRIGALKREIKEVLKLQSEPDVLPFEARLLYRAQCAWGAADSGAPATSRELQLEQLRALFEECASSLKRRKNEHPELRAWLRDVEDKVDAGEAPSNADLRKLLELAREWSGGMELWRRLRVRIEESFSELVILPSLVDVLDTHRSLSDALKAVSNIRKIDSRERLSRQRELLDGVRQRLSEEVGAAGARFRGQLNAATEGLKSGDQAVRHRLTKELGAGFEGLLSAVDEVTGDLTTSLIAPVRDAIKANRGTYDLEDQLQNQNVLSPSMARDLARAYDLFSKCIPSLSRSTGAFTLRVRADDKSANERIRETEHAALRLYKNMREAMAARAEFTLQRQAASIQGALTGLLEQQVDAIASACLSELPDPALEQAIESLRQVHSRNELLRLPEQFFTLPKAVEQRRHVQKEVVGQTQGTETYTTGTCFKDQKTRTVIKNITGAVAYLTLELPDEDGMARQWADGVKAGEASLWETLRNWMVDALTKSSAAFATGIEALLRLADRALEQQLRLAADEYEAVATQWKQIDIEVDRLDSVREGLWNVARSEHA